MAQSLEQFLRFCGFNTQGDLGPLTTYTSRRGKLVYFPRAPPKEPASAEQFLQRTKFRMTGNAWRAAAATKRTAWETLSKRANLRVTGYNLFTYWHMTGDNKAIDTLANQTGIDPR